MRDDVVWLVSYPRSGNTWLRFLMANIQHPEADVNYHSIDKLVPDWHQKGYNWQPDESFNWSPVMVKSHWIYEPDYNKVIYLYRDPRDVALSYYYYSQGDWSIEFKGTFDEYLRRIFIPGGLYGRWDKHINFWFDVIDKSDVLFVKYEELYEDTLSKVITMGNFLGMRLGLKEAELVVNKSSFSELKKIRARDGVHLKKMGLTGRPGGWKKNLTEEQKELIWKEFGKVAEKLGYKEW